MHIFSNIDKLIMYININGQTGRLNSLSLPAESLSIFSQYEPKSGIYYIATHEILKKNIKEYSVFFTSILHSG